MLFFTIRRIISSAIVLLLSSLFVFWMLVQTIDPLAQYRQIQPTPSKAFFDDKIAALGLDDPFFVRYFRWLGGFVTGDFGNNLGGNPVNEELFTRLGVTVRLVAAALIIAVLLAILIGVYTAVRQHKFADMFFSIIAYILIAIPVFWFAALLKEGAIRVNRVAGENLIPTVNEETAGISLGQSGWPVWSDRFMHLILPTLSLAALSYAAWSRFQRASMLDVLGSDYLRLARAKGLPWKRVLFKHGLRNALIPLTTVVALGAGALLSGAVITETVFVWHGLGEYFLTALQRQDQNQLLAFVMLSAFFVVLFNLIADLLYAVLDPRIRLS